MGNFCCIYCVSDKINLVAQASSSKTWRCASCRRRFTIEHEGLDWRLIIDNGPLGSGLQNITLLFGMDRESDIVAAYELAKLESVQREKSGKASVKQSTIGEGKKRLRKNSPVECDSIPNPEFLISLGRNIPRCYAHLVPTESLTRESDVFWPGTAGTHVLQGSIPDGREFISHVEAHICRLAELLGIVRERLDYSSDSASRIDLVINQNPERWLSGERFRGLVAYAGETIRHHIHADWVAEYSAQGDRWEPFLRDSGGKHYNPWLDLYKGILERKGCSLALCVEMEIQGSPFWRTNRSSW